MPENYEVLGTDGFGRSDTREALRRFFEVDGVAVTLAALSQLVRKGDIEASVYQKAAKKFGISTKRNDITELWFSDALKKQNLQHQSWTCV